MRALMRPGRKYAPSSSQEKRESSKLEDESERVQTRQREGARVCGRETKREQTHRERERQKSKRERERRERLNDRLTPPHRQTLQNADI